MLKTGLLLAFDLVDAAGAIGVTSIAARSRLDMGRNRFGAGLGRVEVDIEHASLPKELELAHVAFLEVDSSRTKSPGESGGSCADYAFEPARALNRRAAERGWRLRGRGRSCARRLVWRVDVGQGSDPGSAPGHAECGEDKGGVTQGLAPQCRDGPGSAASDGCPPPRR